MFLADGAYRVEQEAKIILDSNTTWIKHSVNL